MRRPIVLLLAGLLAPAAPAAAAPIFVATGTNDTVYENTTLPGYNVFIPRSEVFVAEARIGNRATNGDREVGLHPYRSDRNLFPTSASPLGSGAELQFAWTSGTANPFTLSRVGSSVTFVMGNYTKTFADLLVAQVNAMSIRVAATTGNTTAISNLRYTVGTTTTNLRGFTANTSGVRDLALLAELTGDFTLAGDLTFTWTGTPTGSALSMQLKAMEGYAVAVPEPATAALLGLGLLGLAGAVRHRRAAA